MPAGWFNFDSNKSGLSTEDIELTQEKGTFEFLDLTRVQRLYCFGACILGGFIVSLIGAICLISGLPGGFAVLFAIGGIISLVGTGFLIGFKRQWKMMWKPVRYVAAIVMIVAIILCFVTAIALPGKAKILCLLFVAFQYLATLWYALSYVPYARAAVKNLASKVI